MALQIVADVVLNVVVAEAAAVVRVENDLDLAAGHPDDMDRGIRLAQRVDDVQPLLALFENRVFRDEAQHDEPHPDQHEQRHRRTHNHRARAKHPRLREEDVDRVAAALAFAAQPRFVPARNAVQAARAVWGVFVAQRQRPLAGQAGERRGVGGRHPVLAEHDHHAFHIELKAGEQVLQRQFAALVRDVVLFDIGQHNAPPILPGDDSHVVAPPILPHTGQVAFHRVIADIRHILAVDDRHAHRARVVIRHQLQLGLKLLVQHEQAADSLLAGVFRQLLCPCPRLVAQNAGGLGGFIHQAHEALGLVRRNIAVVPDQLRLDKLKRFVHRALRRPDIHSRQRLMQHDGQHAAQRQHHQKETQPREPLHHLSLIKAAQFLKDPAHQFPSSIFFASSP